MKILHLISSSGFFGAEKVVLNLITMLKEYEHNPYLLCLKSKAKPQPEIYIQAKQAGITSSVITCKNKLDAEAIRNIKSFIYEHAIELIHTHGYKSNIYGLIVSKLTKIPIITTMHGWTKENSKIKFYEMLDKWVIKGMNYIVSVSPAMTEQLKAMGINNDKIAFIHNGIDVEKFNPFNVNQNFRSELGLGDAFVIVGCVGRLTKEKGHIYLIKALKEITDKIKNVKMLIVGEGSLENSLRSVVDRHWLRDKVIFAGFQKNMSSIYKAMDLFVLPSLTEGLPLSLLEAMSMALPIVATKVGGMPYVVDKESAILISPGNTKELAESLILLLKDKDLRINMGERARQKVVSEFSLEPFYQKYMEVYNKVTTCDLVTL